MTFTESELLTIEDPVVLKEQLIEAIVELSVSDSLSAVERLNGLEVTPKEIMSTCEMALIKIGDKYESGEYYISGLIMAGEIMNRVIKSVAPRMVPNEASSMRGKVLIGTIQGDIHGLGKNIAGALLLAHGFVVKDLGVDVPCQDFIEAISTFKPDIVGLSVLLTSCFSNLKKTIEAIKEQRGSNPKPVIFISGAQISKLHKNFYDADHLVDTAFGTVKLCESIIKKFLFKDD
jgi:5-methyltetrahydrofolate--homocysteine methyltransferase